MTKKSAPTKSTKKTAAASSPSSKPRRGARKVHLEGTDLVVTLPAASASGAKRPKTAAKQKKTPPREEQQYAHSLARRGQIAHQEPLEPGQTHLVKADESGELVLRRKRFSAF